VRNAVRQEPVLSIPESHLSIVMPTR
jgi:hypothetical protein